MDFAGLQRFPLLKDFSAAEVRELFAAAVEQRLAPGAFICREGEPGGSLYFVVHGQVEVGKKMQDGTSLAITQLSDGALLGELSWITGAPYSASVQVTQDAIVVRLDGAELTQQLRKNATAGVKFMTALLQLLAGRLARMNDQMLESQTKLDGQKKGEIERLRERILRDWSF